MADMASRASRALDESWAPLTSELDERDAIGDTSSPWRFVESGWFRSIAAAVIVVNVVAMTLEANSVGSKQGLLVLDHFLLCFYIFEVVSRGIFYRSLYLCGQTDFVAWNVLDITVVTAGVVDQWIVSALPPYVAGALKSLRILRVFRALRIVRIILTSDLSWAESPRFQSFIGVVIGANSLVMGMETDLKWQGWVVAEQVFLVIYAFELAVNLKRQGWFFFSVSNPEIWWNVLDFSIVTSSIGDSWLLPLGRILQAALDSEADGAHQKGKDMQVGQFMMFMRMMRLMRILRLVKLVRSVRPLFYLVAGMMAALSGVVWVLVLTLISLYAMGLVATRLIGHGMIFADSADISDNILVPFSTVPNSMFTLFRVMNGATTDGEAAAIDELMQTQPTLKFAFVFFMITSSWTLLSILTAVVSDRMIATTSEVDRELRYAQQEERRECQIDSLKALFSTIDTSGDGMVSPEEVENFLKDDSNAANKVSSLCHTPPRVVLEVLRSLMASDKHCNGVGIEEFVSRLFDAENVATEKCIMQLAARIEGLEETLQRGFASQQLEPVQHSSLRPVVARQLLPKAPPRDEYWDNVAASMTMDGDGRPVDAAERAGLAAVEASSCKALGSDSEIIAAGSQRQEVSLLQAAIAKLELLVDRSCGSSPGPLDGDVCSLLEGARRQEVAVQAAAARLETLVEQICGSSSTLEGLARAIQEKVRSEVGTASFEPTSGMAIERREAEPQAAAGIGTTSEPLGEQTCTGSSGQLEVRWEALSQLEVASRASAATLEMLVEQSSRHTCSIELLLESLQGQRSGHAGEPLAGAALHVPQGPPEALELQELEELEASHSERHESSDAQPAG